MVYNLRDDNVNVVHHCDGILNLTEGRYQVILSLAWSRTHNKGYSESF